MVRYIRLTSVTSATQESCVKGLAPLRMTVTEVKHTGGGLGGGGEGGSGLGGIGGSGSGGAGGGSGGGAQVYSGNVNLRGRRWQVCVCVCVCECDETL